ncbi:6-phosphogluconolactonase [Henriciella sp.]|uniref:6-phosphogluconolactonase n=1 Tax=Henriciella sp. TaxID=1968823 RepID=UPI00261CF481|nr:6-phosphogluconolactonase [Henriciella sp.]
MATLPLTAGGLACPCKRMASAAEFHAFGTKETFETEAADWIEARLEDALSRRGKATLFCSGGSTPGPIYETLSGLNLDWKNVTVGLADERWVSEDHEASNAALVRRTLLQNKAEAATFLPMKTADESAFGAEAALNESYGDAASVIDVLVLGMGEDGHTLSWFANAKGLGAATDPGNLLSVAAISAPKSKVTGPITERMTLTYPAVARARSILLMMSGDKKKTVFDAANPDHPVSKMRKAAGKALTVFYRS